MKTPAAVGHGCVGKDINIFLVSFHMYKTLSGLCAAKVNRQVLKFTLNLAK